MGIKVQGVWVWSLLLPKERCPGLSALSPVARPGWGSHPGSLFLLWNWCVWLWEQKGLSLWLG